MGRASSLNDKAERATHVSKALWESCFEEASPEAKMAAFRFLAYDVELRDSIQERKQADEARHGSAIPGNTLAAEILREMTKDVRRVVYRAKRRYAGLTEDT